MASRRHLRLGEPNQATRSVGGGVATWMPYGLDDASTTYESRQVVSGLRRVIRSHACRLGTGGRRRGTAKLLWSRNGGGGEGIRRRGTQIPTFLRDATTPITADRC